MLVSAYTWTEVTMHGLLMRIFEVGSAKWR